MSRKSLLFSSAAVAALAALVVALAALALATPAAATNLTSAAAEALAPKAARAKAKKYAAANATLSAVLPPLNATFPRLTAAKVAELRELYEDKLRCKQNPPMLFVPGLFGSYLEVNVTAAGCAAIPQCVAVQQNDPAFYAELMAGPVVLNDFFGLTPTLDLRVDLLVALLTQTYDAQADTLNYSPGVSVASNGTAAGAYCNGVSKTYVDGIIDGYLVKQVGYTIGSTLACLPYNWELDMPGLQQDGSFALFGQLVRELYMSPANDPPLPFLPRKKVVVMGHSMGTLFATSALQAASPEVRAMVDQVVLLSPVAAGSALTWQLTLYGGFEPALSFETIVTEPVPLVSEKLRYFLWQLAQIGAVNPTLAPYVLPPYQFQRLAPPQFPNGFPAGQAVALAYDRADPATSPPKVNVTAGTQVAALQGPLFRTSQGQSSLSYLDQIWARSHSYGDTVAFWSNGAGGGAPPPANITIQCAYGVAVESILTSAAKAPFPFPADPKVGFQQVDKLADKQALGLGDGVVNLQGNNGCDRMADATGGLVFPCTSTDCEHILIVKNGPGARALLNQVLNATGINVNPPMPTPAWCAPVNMTQVVG